MKPENNIRKKEPFAVPEGYFESLTDRVAATVQEREASVPLIHGSRSRTGRTRLYLSVAAALTAVAILTAGAYSYLTDRGRNRLSLNNPSVLVSEAMAEEIDICTIEAELLEYADAEQTSADISNDMFESLVIENIEETDIYDL